MADTAEIYGLRLEFDSSSDFALDIPLLIGQSLEFNTGFVNPSFCQLCGSGLEFDSGFSGFAMPQIKGLHLELSPHNKIAPEPSLIATIRASQIDNSSSGIPVAKLSWSNPNYTEYIPGEYISKADGTSASYRIANRNIVDSTDHPIEVYEVVQDSTNKYTTLSSDATFGNNILYVNDSSAIIQYSWIKLERQDGYPAEYNRIVDMDSSSIKLHFPITNDYPSGFTVRKVWVDQKYDGTHFNLDFTTGKFEEIAGGFTPGSDIFIKYKFELSNFDHYELWRVDGSRSYDYNTSFHQISLDPTSKFIATLASGITSYDATMDATDNAENYTFFVFGIDKERDKSFGNRAFMEMLPPIPVDLDSTLDDITLDVLLSFSVPPKANIDGVNIYRSIGSWDSINSIKLNTVLITDSTFIDGTSNTTNRVSEAIAPYPSKGNAYTYRIEAVDSVTDWTTGTQNAVEGHSYIENAEKSPESPPVLIPPGWTDEPIS